MILLRHGQSEFNLLFTQTRKDPGIIDPKLTPLGQTQAEEAAEALVRERYAFTCDIGRPITELRLDFPHVVLDHIDEIWWPPVEEPAEQVIDRAQLFRAEMAALQDWSHTLVVSHWGFILAFTGKSVMNGQLLRVDPTEAPPAEITWKH